MKEKRRKTRKFLVIVIILMMIPLVLFSFANILVGDVVDSMTSVSKLDNNLYYMEYNGDYKLDEFVSTGVNFFKEVSNSLKTYMGDTERNFGCSVISSIYEGKAYYGRNYDSVSCKAIIVHTKPEDGYESFSTCNINSLNLGEDFDPLDSVVTRMCVISSIFYPVDGMNSEGLMASILTVEDQEIKSQDTGKTKITMPLALRLLLDNCNDIDSAIDLLNKYDVVFDGNGAQLFIAEKSGKSVSVSYIDSKMVVTETNVLTNHYIDKTDDGSDSFTRYNELIENGSLNSIGIKDALKSVAMSNYSDAIKTMWSIVYDPNEPSVYFNFNENFDRNFKLNFGDSNNWELI